MSRTIATLFSGGELAGVGAHAAGLRHLWGVEYDAQIAGVAHMNGYPSIVARVQDVDYTSMEAPHWLHMSPPCTTASTANTNGGESEMDLEMAGGCVKAIEALQPPMVSLENVYGYRNYESFRRILAALHANAYSFDFWHLNAADYGVPQTRQRLILVASKHHRPKKPAPTHHEPGSVEPSQMSFFEPATAPWVGWYEAIEDLIPTLPASKFADWQLKRLHSAGGSFMHPYSTADGTTPPRGTEEPMFSITSTVYKNMPRALLVSNSKTEWGDGTRDGDGPAHAITQQHRGRYRALLVQDGNTFAPVAEGGEPSPTIRAKGAPRAFVVDGKLNDRGRSLTTRDSDAPFFTVTTSHNSRDIKAQIPAGRVVKLTVRALARLQSVPDSYKLPDSNQLAARVIGNGVPCLLMQRVVEAQEEAQRRAA